MIGERLKQLRLARGLSLDDLALKLEGAVTKQALSKYEQDKDSPSLSVLNKLAIVLNVPRTRLWGKPEVRVEVIAYRKQSDLPVKEQLRVQSGVAMLLEERVRLQRKVQPELPVNIPIEQFLADTPNQLEAAAERVRDLWNLGADAIASVTNVLEDNGVHVLEVDADERFDGISLVAYNVVNPNEVAGAAVVTRTGIVGDRQRFSLAHELGHLVLKQGKLDPEKAAHQFSGAFLAPANTLRREVGARRSRIEGKELLLLKSQFGMSVQALLYRMRELEIIDPPYFSEWFATLNRFGYRKVEPNPIPPESSQWLQRNVFRAVSEGLLTIEEAENMLGERIVKERGVSLSTRQAVLLLSLEERRHILERQAKAMAAHYSENTEWEELAGGDVIEY